MKENPSSALPPTRIAVGMSGGLDSSVVAALCAEAGHEVIGMTLHLFREGSRCCSIEDVERARKMCDLLGIRHYTLNAVDEFDETIIRPFVDGYAAGHTPSPCVLCNEHIKFGTLHRRALQLGCTHIASGHYVKLERRDGRWRLLRAADAKKDQSYFLHRLDQEQLARCHFPLAGWMKTEVAAYAREHKLPVQTSSKDESQDLCFVPDEGHGDFVEARRPDLPREGEIVDPEGRVLGIHRGIHRFTIGQRKGIGIAAPERLYVKDLDPATGQVIVAPREEIVQDHCLIEAAHWISGSAPTEPFDAAVRIRYRSAAVPCRVEPLTPTRARLRFAAPQFAVSPGQAAVLYEGDEVLGGGWISSRKPA